MTFTPVIPPRISIDEPYFRQDGEYSFSRPEYARSYKVNYKWTRDLHENKKLAN